MTVRKSEKDKEITRLKRELNKVNNDLAKKRPKGDCPWRADAAA